MMALMDTITTTVVIKFVILRWKSRMPCFLESASLIADSSTEEAIFSLWMGRGISWNGLDICVR